MRNKQFIMVAVPLLIVGAAIVHNRFTSVEKPGLPSPSALVQGQLIQAKADADEEREPTQDYTEAELDDLAEKYASARAERQEEETAFKRGKKRFAEEEPRQQRDDEVFERLKQDLQKSRQRNAFSEETYPEIDVSIEPAVGALRLAIPLSNPQNSDKLRDVLKKTLNAQSLWRLEQTNLEAGKATREANGLSKDANAVRQNLDEALVLLSKVVESSVAGPGLEQLKAAQGFLQNSRKSPYLQSIADLKLSLALGQKELAQLQKERDSLEKELQDHAAVEQQIRDADQALKRLRSST